jgi:predicted hydrocarbon binding protein
MKGIINKGIQETIVAKYGSETWEKVKTAAHIEDVEFDINRDYPDETSVALIQGLADIRHISPAAVMIECGQYMVPNTLRKHYPTYFAMAGHTPREFLFNIANIHDRATRDLEGATPPYFDYEQMPDGRLRIHYKSQRKLCPFLHGLILGVGNYFNQALQVKETACMHQGALECTMEVTFPST